MVRQTNRVRSPALLFVKKHMLRFRERLETSFLVPRDNKLGKPACILFRAGATAVRVAVRGRTWGDARAAGHPNQTHPAMTSDESSTYELTPEQELRVEVNHGNAVAVTLVDGSAEVFGTELAKGSSVTLPGGKHAVFTWTGATLHTQGVTESMYVASETPMVEYVNVSSVLDERRQIAKNDLSKNMQGPRVALVGPTDVGKSTLCKILLSYAVKKGWHPLFCDLDLGQNGIGPPGTVGAVPVDRQIDAKVRVWACRQIPRLFDAPL